MIEIKLKNNIEDLRAIYFRDNHQKIFFGPNTKKQSIYLTLTLIVYPFFTFYALNSNDSWFFILGSMSFSLLVYDFWRVAKPILVWKKSVETFLKKAEKITDLRLKYNDEFFIYVEDSQELKQNWDVLEKAILNQDFIWLFSDTNVLLPKSSMHELEFHGLHELISHKVKNVQKS